MDIFLYIWIKFIRIYYKRKLLKIESTLKKCNCWCIDIQTILKIIDSIGLLFILIPIDVYESTRTITTRYNNVEELVLHLRYIVDWMDSDFEKSYEYTDNSINTIDLSMYILDGDKRRLEIWTIIETFKIVLGGIDFRLKQLGGSKKMVVTRSLYLPLTNIYSTLEILLNIALLD